MLRNPQRALAANQFRQHVHCKLFDPVFLAARQIQREMRDVQATGAIDKDEDAWDAAMRIQSALEQAGVRFLPDEPGHGGIGVRLTGPAQRSLPLS